MSFPRRSKTRRGERESSKESLRAATVRERIPVSDSHSRVSDSDRRWRSPNRLLTRAERPSSRIACSRIMRPVSSTAANLSNCLPRSSELVRTPRSPPVAASPQDSAAFVVNAGSAHKKARLQTATGLPNDSFSTCAQRMRRLRAFDRANINSHNKIGITIHHSGLLKVIQRQTLSRVAVTVQVESVDRNEGVAPAVDAG